MALTIDGSDPTGDLGDLLAAKADYPSGGSNGDLLTKSGTTTAWATPPSLAGLVLITSETFSAVTSVSINNCFTSSYENYRVIATIQEASNMTIGLRMRAAGTDASGANTYYFTNGFSASPNTYADFSRAAPGPTFLCADVASPAVATPTRWLATRMVGSTSITNTVPAIYHTPSTAYDGFTVSTDGPNISGTIRVYGYRNS